MNRKYFSISQAFKYSFGTVLDNFSTYLPVALFYIALSAGFSYAFSFNTIDLALIQGKGISNPVFLRYFGYQLLKVIAVLVVALVFSLGLTNIGLKIYDKKNVSIEDFYSGYPVFRAMGAIFLVFLVTYFGFLLLIVPGLVWGSRYMFATDLVIDKNLNIKESMRASALLTFGVKLKLFFTVLLVIFMSAFITFGVLYFSGFSLAEPSVLKDIISAIITSFLMPLTSMVLVYIYKQLLSQVKDQDFLNWEVSDKLNLKA